LQVQPPFARIGTRGSLLALAQAHEVRDRLAQAHGVEPHRIDIVVIKTTGDRITDRPLSEAGGKGLFTKEIEEALLAHEIDLAVHSSKDMPSQLPPGLVLPVFLAREDVRDAFVSLKYETLDQLPLGAVFGTSSLRRAAQMRRYRPDLQIVGFRGNVQTRLGKLADGIAEGTLLAAAGLHRLGEEARIAQYLDPVQFPPAPAQGAIGIEIRQDDARTRTLIAPLEDRATAIAVRAERAYLDRLEGSCRTPIAAYSTHKDGNLTLLGEILSIDGQQSFSERVAGPASDPEALGIDVAERLLEAAGPGFLSSLGQ